MPLPASTTVQSRTSAASGPSPAFNPHSLYSSANALSTPSSSTSHTTNTTTTTTTNNNHATPFKPGAQTPSSDTSITSSRKKQSKRRKVNLACIYCRRSHMTCDEGRPCQRCIKRDIGHLCHDESATKQHASTASPPSKRANTPIAPPPSASAELATPPPPRLEEPSLEGGDAVAAVTAAGNGGGGGGGNDALPYFGASGLDILPATGASSVTGDSGGADAAFLGTSAGPYSSVSPLSSLNPDNRISPFNQAAIFRDSASPLKGQAQAQGTGYSAPESLSLSATGLNTGASVFDWGLGSTNGGLGGAGWLGLGGGPGGFEGGGQGFSGDSAGGNEFTLLSEFLESLDGSVFGASSLNSSNQKLQSYQPAQAGPADLGNPSGQSISRGGSRRNTVSGRAANLTGEASTSSSRASLPPPGSGLDMVDQGADAGKGPVSAAAAAPSRPAKRPRGLSVSAALKPEDNSSSSNNNASPYPPSLGAASKTERFFLTAADQKDGSRDERLSRVIQAKYEAGLLRPYNHVNGYARLNRWMERNVSQASKRRILKPLSVFRPAFRAVAQSLTNIDLIFIEEAFERLLLDYDRVFSTQGIPACLWRRTGEIYKGNKEFAELVGVPIESLREGRLCIYELMAEESAVNYWEKYGAVSFDPGQKAVLTSCVLRTKNKSMLTGNKDKQSSTKLIAAQLPRAHGTTSSGQTTPTLAPQTGGAAAGLFPLTPLDGDTRAGMEATPSKTGGKDVDKDGKKPDASGTAMAASGSSTGGGAGAAGVPNAAAASGSANGSVARGAATPNKDAKVSHIHCCFSFTIRRDQWNIPTMIVGNFLPTNPP